VSGTGTLIILWCLSPHMARLVPPTERTCERCGRHDIWDPEQGTWAIATEDDEKQIGSPYCLHEWDINGDYNPLPERS